MNTKDLKEIFGEPLSIEAIRDYWKALEISDNPTAAREDIFLLCEEVERLERASEILLQSALELLEDTDKLNKRLRKKIRQYP